MTILIEDSPRPNLGGWICDAYTAGLCGGTVMTPFATPWVQRAGGGKKPSLRTRAGMLNDASVPLWFDATTHALWMGGVGDFRFYDEYDLWEHGRGDLSTRVNREGHIRRAFDIQDQIGARHLAPTILLHTGLSTDSQLALQLAEEAVRQDANCWLTVAGTTPFWSNGSALDAHIGALAQLAPHGWFLTAAHPIMTMPAEATVEEVHGLCRTARALSEDSVVPVHISHGDLAALPAIAAGASSVGSGWDKRQRLCAYSDYAPREEGGSGGSWLMRATLAGLLGSITENEAAVLARQDPALVTVLGGLPPAPGPKEAFMHHLTQLSSAARSLRAQVDPQLRADDLQTRYSAAAQYWPEVERITACNPAANGWIYPFATGLEQYQITEHWR